MFPGRFVAKNASWIDTKELVRRLEVTFILKVEKKGSDRVNDNPLFYYTAHPPACASQDYPPGTGLNFSTIYAHGPFRPGRMRSWAKFEDEDIVVM